MATSSMVTFTAAASVAAFAETATVPEVRVASVVVTVHDPGSVPVLILARSVVPTVWNFTL